MLAVFLIGFDNVAALPVHLLDALLDPYGPLADSLDLLHRVADEDDRRIAAIDERFNPVLTFLLEEDVANAQRLVDDEDIGMRDCGDCECDAGNHTARIVLQRHLHEPIEFCEVDDSRDALFDE